MKKLTYVLSYVMRWLTSIKDNVLWKTSTSGGPEVQINSNIRLATPSPSLHSSNKTVVLVLMDITLVYRVCNLWFIFPQHVNSNSCFNPPPPQKKVNWVRQGRSLWHEWGHFSLSDIQNWSWPFRLVIGPTNLCWHSAESKLNSKAG